MCSTPGAPAPASADLALIRVTVVDVESGRLLADRAVVLNGRHLDRETLNALLAEVIEPELERDDP